MHLIVVETLGKQRQIEGLLRKLTLDNQWSVVSCAGHYCGFPKNNVGVDHKTLEPVWKVRNIQAFEKLKKLVSECDSVNALTDLSPEGEAIANQIRITSEFGAKPFNRIRLASLDSESLASSLASPSSLDQNTLQCYLAREVVDRLVQFVLSPVVSTRLGTDGIHLNRMSVLLLSEVARVERKIRRFVSFECYSVRALLSDGSFAESGPMSSLREAEEVVRRSKAAIPAFTSGRSVDPTPTLFNLSTLIQFASSRYGIDALTSIQTCENLYNQGLITYPYTSSTGLSHNAAKEIHEFVRTKLHHHKVADFPVTHQLADGMEGIRPVQISLIPSSANLSGDSKSIYSAIWFRSTGSQGLPAKVENNLCSYTLDDQEVFVASGSTLVEGGWHQLSGRLFETSSRPLSSEAYVIEASVIPFHSWPPKRHTHGSLISWLDSTLSSRPWTYKQALESLTQNSYVEYLGGGLLKITDKGETVLTFIRRALPDLLDLSFESQLEKDIASVGSGHSSFESVVRKYWQWATAVAASASSKSLRPSFTSPSGNKLKVYLEKNSGKPYTKAKGEDWWSYISFDGEGKIVPITISV